MDVQPNEQYRLLRRNMESVLRQTTRFRKRTRKRTKSLQAEDSPRNPLVIGNNNKNIKSDKENAGLNNNVGLNNNASACTAQQCKYFDNVTTPAKMCAETVTKNIENQNYRYRQKSVKPDQIFCFMTNVAKAINACTAIRTVKQKGEPGFGTSFINPLIHV